MMNIPDDTYLFFPDGINPSEELFHTGRCARLPIAWALCGRQVSNSAQWLVDTCAYQEIEKGNELAAICTGYCQLREILSSEFNVSAENEKNKLSQMLASYCKMQLAALIPDMMEFPPLASLPEIRDAAANLIFGQGNNETHLFYTALLAHFMPDDWLSNMAQAQLRMYETQDNSTAEAVANLWQLMQDALLPVELQTAAFLENILYHTCIALTAAYPEEAAIWSGISELFLNTLEIKEDTP